MSIGVIIARFQTPFLHEGHISLINEVKSEHSKCVILLGVSPIKGSSRNPFDYFARERMIKGTFADLVILPLCDHPSDALWSQNIDQLLIDTFPGEKFKIYGSRDSFIPYYSGKNETIELPEHGEFNATEIRKQYADKVLDSVDFRAGILYAYNNQYSKVYPTVDIAVFKNKTEQILLGRKSNSRLWRLIGGFCDPEDNSFEESALRELQEECGEIQVTNLTYFKSQKIQDWRYKNESDKIISTVFTCEYQSGTPIPSDDIVDLQWFNLKNLDMELISPEHVALMQLLQKEYN